MINSIVIILIVVASLWNCRKCVDAQTLSIQQGSCVKGLAALLLIPVHIGNSMQQPGAAYKFMSSVGFLLVAIFFFYSGYGTAKKSIRDPEYFKRKIPKRIIYLIKMMIITETVYVPKAFDKTQVVVLSVLIIITTVIISGLVHEIEKKVKE